MVKVGDVVSYFDENCQERNALVQCVHSQDYVNLVVISKDESRTDCYGRQIEHPTSVGRLSEHNKAGRYFVERQ